MDKKTVFVKTTKGENEIKGKGGSLSGDLKRALFLIDDKSIFDDISKRSAPSLRSVLPDVFRQLVAGGYIRDKAKPFAEPQITVPRVVSPESSGELDFTAVSGNPVQKSPLAETGNVNAEAQAKAQKEADAARARAEFEAAVEATKIKSRAEAEAKAEANAKQTAEIEARNRTEADARAKQEALLKAQAEAKAKIEAEARTQAERAAALVKQQMEVAAKAKAEAEARLKAELEAAAKAKAEAEAAQIKAEQEAVRIKIELEAAKAKAEAEAKALAEERARQEAAEAARIKAEHDAARIKAEQEAAKVKAEAEARAFAEERARKEVEAARIKAEQEAARIKAEHEAARVTAEAEARALAEERAIQEATRIKAEQEAAKAKAEAQVRQETERRKAEQDATKAKAEAVAKEEAEAVAMAEEQARQAAGIKALQEVEAARLKAEQIAAKAMAEAATQQSEPAPAIPDKRFEVESALLERTISGQEYALRMAAEAEAQKMADEQAKAWAEAESRAKDQARAEAERPVQAVSPARSTAIPVASKARRKPLPTGKIFAALLVVLLLSVWLLPSVMPLADYIAPIEKSLSAQLKQPVHVGGLHAAILPWPKLQLEKVTVGSGQELKVGNVMLSFDPLTLFSPVKNIRVVELQDVVLDGTALDKEAVWLQEIGANTAYQVSHVVLQRIQVASAEVTLPLFKGEVDINGQGRIAKIALKSGDGKFDLTLQPAQALWAVTLNAKGATFPLFPNVLLDDFTANGEISASGANFADIDVQAYGGFLRGNAKLTWQKGWQVQGHIGAKSVELVKLFPKFGVSGELQGESNFSSSGSKLGLIADAQQMDGSFVVTKGIVNNMDMVETVRLGNRQAGRTHFDELTGAFQSNGRGSHFQQLQISSGILSGKGAFDVGSNSQISGRLSVELKSRAGVSPLTLSGTLTEPVLRPGR